MFIYSVYDKIAKKHLNIGMAETDAEFVRENLFLIVMNKPILDMECYCIGEFFDDSGIIAPFTPRLVDWNCYQFPKSADSLEKTYLTIDELVDKALEKKKQNIEKQKNYVEDIKKQLKDVENEIARITALPSDDVAHTNLDSLKNYKNALLEQIKSLSQNEEK